MAADNPHDAIVEEIERARAEARREAFKEAAQIARRDPTARGEEIAAALEREAEK